MASVEGAAAGAEEETWAEAAMAAASAGRVAAEGERGAGAVGPGAKAASAVALEAAWTEAAMGAEGRLVGVPAAMVRGVGAAAAIPAAGWAGAAAA